MEISNELYEKALTCTTEEELLALAAENGIEVTEEQAKAFLGRSWEGEISDEELGDVAGGQLEGQANGRQVVYYRTKEEVQHIFRWGDLAKLTMPGITQTLGIGVIVGVAEIHNSDGWFDVYLVEAGPQFAELRYRWQNRSRFN